MAKREGVRQGTGTLTVFPRKERSFAFFTLCASSAVAKVRNPYLSAKRQSDRDTPIGGGWARNKHRT